MDYIIRKAKTEDVKRLNDLLTKLIRDEKQYNDNINENYVVDSFYENVISNDEHCLLVAEVDKEVIGYLYGYIQNNGATCINIVAQLDALYVCENYRKFGIANALICEFKKWSRSMNAKYIELKVCSGNKTAIALYKKCGFNDTQMTMITELY